ncbi:N-methyl-L-tryptophan oxidase [Actinobacteria bacterium YIM 96077]|uniref:N-methyl-L-tryptophan oxidase n=1 Tax=Phytoactinopolyspora halophila TaxID=1981511 RepID=A0A329QZ30_9ACTN|nr:N-methyl-L-tryptophan oxidase [Phytoactinopolyspora halophila]AYY15467.1 N-methyl-L-tryptophan oxidase [Actinobacteria bacterium YIM 96077]RAW17674.1 N-methyl-L-tryptophan oxidase [Phytoactinopolyspora halophila]
MQHYEVIVVGLGAMGSATTYHLARAGARTLGIDQFAPPHTLGSTHGDTRITRQAVGEGDAYVQPVLRSHELWRELEAEADVSLFDQVGGLILAPASGGPAMHGAEDFFAATLKLAQRHRIDHEVLPAAELARRFPQFRLGDEPKAADVVGYYEPGAGVVRAEAAVQVQLDLAERRGAHVSREEQVLDVTPSPTGVTVTTDRGSYGADTVVLSAGPWIRELVEPEIGELFTVHRQLMSWFTLDRAAQTAGTFEPGRCPVFIWQFGTTEEDVFYGIPAVDGPSGGVKIGTEGYGATTDPHRVERAVDPTEPAETFERCLRGRVPALQPAALRSVTCLYTVSPDSGFVIDRHPEHDRLIIASPCSGHGFKHSPAIGESLAELATTGTSTLDTSPFRLSRFAAPS